MVHIDLLSDDREIASTAVRYLEQRFRDYDVEGHAEPGAVRLHSEPERPVPAATLPEPSSRRAYGRTPCTNGRSGASPMSGRWQRGPAATVVLRTMS